MKYTKQILGLVVLVAIVASSGAVGCKRKPKGQGAGSGMDMLDPAGLGPMGAGGYGSEMNPDALQTIASQFEAVYFEYDSAQISASERAKLEAVAEYLRGAPDVGLVVEGHCDERGSNEYNVALGERRAQAARAYIVGLGIASERIRTISYGEEQPVAFGHDEESWRLNRRAQFSLFQ
jgi:peptidoglycan-associated lipoprotein